MPLGNFRFEGIPIVIETTLHFKGQRETSALLRDLRKHSGGLGAETIGVDIVHH